MATSDILGLFMSPEQYQAQQMAQQQAAEQQRAFNFAQLSPRDQAVYGMFLGGQQLARGLGGLLGVQDPQLQRIRQRQEIMQSINPADMASLEQGILRASQTGDSELALSLTDFMRKQGSEMALAQQRKAAAEKSRAPSIAGGVQAAARINAINLELDTLNIEDPEDIPKINALTAELTQLQKDVSQKMTEAERNATIVANNTGFAPGTPEYREAFNEAFNRFVAPKDRQPTTVEQLESLYTRLAKVTENAQNINPDPEAVAKNPEVVLVKKLIEQVEKKDKPNISAAAQLVIDRGFEYGTPSFYAALDEELERQKPPAPAPERVRINAEVRKRKEEQKKLKPDSEEYKAIQEDIDYLENRKEGRQPNVSAAVDEIALADFNKAYIDLTPEQRAKVLNKQKEEAKKETDISYGVDREATAAAEFGKQFKDLDQNQKKAVNKIVDAERRINAPKVEIKNVLPKEPIDIAQTEKAIRETVEPQLRTVTTVDSALATLRLAKEQNNPSAFNAARVQLAKSLGDSTLSAADIRNAGGDPSLWGTIRDKTSTVVFGTPGNPTFDAVEKTLLAIRKVARKQATNTLDRQKRLAQSATFNDGTKIYTEQQIRDLFTFPDLNPEITDAGSKPPPKKTVPYNALPRGKQ
jgi:hypothetical protein